MAKPTGTLPEWATDPAPGGIDEPSGGKIETGWIPGEIPPAEEFNWWMNMVGKVIVWLFGIFDSNDDLTYPTPKLRRKTYLAAEGFGVGFTDIYDDQAITFDGGGPGYLQIVPRLHAGCVIDKVEVRLRPSTTTLVSAPRMSIDILKFNVTNDFDYIGDPWESILTAPVFAANDANEQMIIIPDIDYTIAAESTDPDIMSHLLMIRVWQSADNAAPFDKVRWVRVYYTDPGPRGY